MNERFGSINRIDDPLPTRGADLVVEFFSQDRIVREGLHNQFSPQRFGAAIRLRNRRAILLLLDVHGVAIEIFKGQIAHLTRQVYGKFKTVLHWYSSLELKG